MKKSKILFVVISIFLCNLLVVGGAALYNNRDPVADENQYIDIARKLYEGIGFFTDQKLVVNEPILSPPYPVSYRFLYPYLVSCFFRAFGKTSPQIAGFTSAVFKALLAVTLFYLAYELYGYRTAVLTSVLYFINPFYNNIGIVALTDMTSTFFYYTSLLLVLLYVLKRNRLYIVAGSIAFSLAWLTREELILLGFLVAVALLLLYSSWRDALLFICLSLPAFVARGWYLYCTFGSFFYNPRQYMMLPAWEFFYSLEPFTWSKYLNYVGSAGGAVAIRIHNFILFTCNLFSDGIVLDTDRNGGILPLLSIPFIMMAYLRKVEWEKKKFIIIFFLIVSLQVMLSLAYPGYLEVSAARRHGQIIAPFLLIMTSAGLVGLYNSGKARSILERGNPKARDLTRYLARVLLAVFAINYLFFCSIFTAIEVDQFFTPHSASGSLKNGALWCRENLAPTSILMARKAPDIQYFSQRPSVVVPLGDFSAIMTYAKRNGVTHIIVTSEEEHKRPNLLPGINALPTSFKLVHEQRKFQVYEVLSYDFLHESLPPMEEEQYLNKDLRPKKDPSPKEILFGSLWPGRRDNLGRSLRVWGRWLAEGKRAGQEWWDGVKYGQLNWLFRLVCRPEHRLEADFGKFRVLGYSLHTNALEDKGVLDVALYWQSLEPVEEDYIIVVKLVNDVYHVWGESQGKLWGDEFWASRWAEELVIGDSHRIELLAATPPGLYRLEVNVIDPHSWQTLEPDGEAKMLSEPLEIPRRSLIVEALDMEHPLGADLGNKVRLLGYNVESGFRPGDNIHLTLFWQCLEEIEQSYTVFTHLVDAGDNIMAQKDNPPVDGFYPTTKWEIGEIVRDQYDLVIPSDIPSGEYRLKVGMYLAETGERLNILKDGVPLPDNRILLQPVAIGGAE